MHIKSLILHTLGGVNMRLFKAQKLITLAILILLLSGLLALRADATNVTSGSFAIGDNVYSDFSQNQGGSGKRGSSNDSRTSHLLHLRGNRKRRHPREPEGQARSRGLCLPR